ncbi:MAG: Holliday junction branch migration protein RuvA [Myxococcota bacterium]|jgi:holliday junction DNA helicase RuvA|nr:Holliday junction branch migration protein RuvA [Myxococcota bacterium]
MIGKLKGVVAAEEPPVVTLDVGGVGYEVQIPAGTLGRARASEREVELWVHTVVRADALELFGFSDEGERRIFRLLINVPNVGPRTALGVMSALTTRDLAQAIRAGDAARLTKVPGVGKKTAERLVLELKDKLATLVTGLDLGHESDPKRLPTSPERPGDARSRLLSALTNMGYRPAEAERAVQALGQRVGAEPLGDLLREALAELSA